MENLDPKTQEIVKIRKEICEIQNNASALPAEAFCPGTFDGWSCWPHTIVGKTVYTQCPAFVTGFDDSRIAHKECTENASWFRHPESQTEWSNYTNCINYEDFALRQSVTTVNEIGYSISLIALLLSLALLNYFKSLRCARITLHKNLFTSFAINNVFWLIWYITVLNTPNVLKANQIWCQALHVIIHYVLLTNYSWMLCEGLYLHTVLVSAFVAEQRLLTALMVLGWVMPLLVIIVYTITRGINETYTKQCWVDETPPTHILHVAVAITILLNLVFLCNIVRVLCIKLREAPSRGSQGPSRTAVQAFRATLLLVPLLGLQYLIIFFRPPRDHPWELVYEYVAAIVASLQGLCVAILYCFCNGEVIAQVKRKWRTAMFRPRANSCSATTVSFVRSTPHALAGEEKV